MINLGLLIVVIALLGYASNWLNWRYLNYFWVRFLYRIGVVVHEFSHAIFCVLTFAKIKEIKLFSRQPRVVYTKPKIPLLGNFLISIAPIIGGLAVLFLLNKFILADYFVLPRPNDISSIIRSPLDILLQINLLQWQSWLMIFLLLNTGAMIGPSFQDLKNIWPLIIIAIFIRWSVAIELCTAAVALIAAGILVQLVIATIIFLAKKLLPL